MIDLPFEWITIVQFQWNAVFLMFFVEKSAVGSYTTWVLDILTICFCWNTKGERQVSEIQKFLNLQTLEFSKLLVIPRAKLTNLYIPNIKQLSQIKQCRNPENHTILVIP